MAEQRSPEEIEYSKIKSFLLTLVGIATAFLSIIGSVVIYTTFADRNSMREDYEKTIIQLKSEIKDLKLETKESMSKINQQAQDDISRIKFSTNQLAIEETQKELKYIFGSDKIEQLIENQATEKVKEKVDEIVEKETKEITLISDAASQMRIGLYNSISKIKYFIKNAKNKNDRERASTLYQNVCNDYNEIALRRSDTDFSLSIYQQAVLREKFANKTTYNESDSKVSESEIVMYLVKKINDNNENLNDTAKFIIALSKITNQNFRCFQIEEINKWYKEYLKTNK